MWFWVLWWSFFHPFFLFFYNPNFFSLFISIPGRGPAEFQTGSESRGIQSGTKAQERGTSWCKQRKPGKKNSFCRGFLRIQADFPCFSWIPARELPPAWRAAAPQEQRGKENPGILRDQPGPQGHPCKQLFAAFSVGRRKALHSSDYFQLVTFDTELVNLYQHFNMFSGKFFCYVPGVYYFSLNVHTWNFKETYVHLMRNEQAVAILYAQPSDRSIMQSQSLMLDLQEGEEVWVRMFKRERENAIYSEESDLYIIFNGHLIKPALE
nr:LOW QUALITY PROTEIN: complement C1q tumor necrosis factor-related protein 1 [Zonotrichia albicollis]